MKSINVYGKITDIEANETPNGTCFQGYLNISYEQLKKTFGKPLDGDGYKVDAEWIIKTPKGIATIYNYKNGINYNGKSGTPKTRITEWHIGGLSQDVIPYILLATH